LDDIVVGSRFLWNVPTLLRNPITREEARATLRRRFEQREDGFLAGVGEAIYGNPTSPYRRLLALAGCEYGDVEKLVRQEGIEGALGALFRQGVYLTLDELKGRRPVVRGRARIAVDPGLLGNPLSRVHLPAQTSGSRGARTRVGIDLLGLRDEAIDTALVHAARGGRGWQNAIWGVPGGWSIIRILDLGAFGAAPVRWFSQVDPMRADLPPRYRLSARALRWGGRLAGVRLPRPRHVSLDDPLPIARWMADVLRDGKTPNLVTFATSAVRLCRAAVEARIDLSGARFTISGEPITPARVAAIHRVGGEVMPRCGITELGAVGHGCLAPEAADDLHFLTDLHAVIQPGPAGAPAGLPPRALLVSSLRPKARMILLNASLGDQATLVRRDCGCPLAELGWKTHIHSVRSYEKLTAGGMMFPDAEIIRVLEEVLPARFGGGATDYQLREEEGLDGSPRLRLLVHPALGSLDPDAVAHAFLDAIGSGTGAAQITGLTWREAGLVRVERQAPGVTAAGKILHWHHARPSGVDASPARR
jgi:hypothetical protein